MYQRSPPRDSGPKPWANSQISEELGLRSFRLQELQQQHAMFLPNFEFTNRRTGGGDQWSTTPICDLTVGKNFRIPGFKGFSHSNTLYPRVSNSEPMDRVVYFLPQIDDSRQPYNSGLQSFSKHHTSNSPECRTCELMKGHNRQSMCPGGWTAQIYFGLWDFRCLHNTTPYNFQTLNWWRLDPLSTCPSLTNSPDRFQTLELRGFRLFCAQHTKIVELVKSEGL
jgi:hypothetical protein